MSLIAIFSRGSRLCERTRDRGLGRHSQKDCIVTIHVNYHPDKYERMLAVVKFYVKGEKAALDGFPEGSER